MEKLCDGDKIKLFLADETIDKFRNADKYGKNADGSTAKPKFKLNVIFEDDDILVINKPVDMLSQKADKNDVSLVEYISWYLEKISMKRTENLKVLSRNMQQTRQKYEWSYSCR